MSVLRACKKGSKEPSIARPPSLETPPEIGKEVQKRPEKRCTEGASKSRLGKKKLRNRMLYAPGPSGAQGEKKKD